MTTATGTAQARRGDRYRDQHLDHDGGDRDQEVERDHGGRDTRPAKPLALIPWPERRRMLAKAIQGPTPAGAVAVDALV